MTTLTYNGSGQLTSVTEPNPNNAYVTGETVPVITFGYTSGKLTTMEDPDYNTTTYSYDSATGALASVEYPDTTSCQFQAALTLPLDNGKCLTPSSAIVATTTDQSHATTTYTLDQFGNPLTVTDALGHETIYARDANGLVTAMYRPDPTTGITVASSSDPAEPVTTYDYDAYGNLISEMLPDGTQETSIYAYDTDASTARTDR